MKGRSPEQLAAYEARLSAIASILTSGPASVREIQVALGICGEAPVAATVHARVRALKRSGLEVRWRKRREWVAEKRGQRERVYYIGEVG